MPNSIRLVQKQHVTDEPGSNQCSPSCAVKSLVFSGKVLKCRRFSVSRPQIIPLELRLRLTASANLT